MEHLIRPSIRRHAFYILTRIAYVNIRMIHRKLEILAYVRVEAHDVDILNGLILPCLVVDTHGLGSTPVQGIMGTQRTLLHNGMSEQFGPPCIVRQTHIPIGS